MFTLCVKITVDPSFTESIDKFVIDWGDGTDTTILVGGPVPPTPIPATLTHTYDFSDFYGTCSPKDDRTVFLFTHVTGDPVPLNNGFFMNVFNPPVPNFSTNSPVCEGETVTLVNNSCPTQGLTSQPWDYGDGTTGTSNMHTYANPGTYTVTLTVSNQCATATATHQVEVLELPQANPIVTKGIKEELGDTLVVCVGDTLQLNGDSLSLNETSWRWDFLNSISAACFDYVPPPQTGPYDVSVMPRPKLVFFCDGVYRLELKVNNPCDNADAEVLILKVVKQPSIEFSLNESDCSSSITLNPADYLQVNGELKGCSWDFGPQGTSTLCNPGDITFNSTTTVTFTGWNQCDTVSLTGQVTLTPSGQAAISTTCPDTLCSNDPPCTLSANLPGGMWKLNGQAFGPSFNPAAVPKGLNTITYGNPPCIQPDTIQLFVVDAAVNLTGPAQVCYDGGTVTFTASPPGGVFSSTKNAIDPVTGVYDPTVAGPGPDKITYALPATALCPGTDELDIIVTQLSVGFEVTSCDGTTLCFATSAGTSSYNSIQWDFGDGQTSFNSTPCHTYANATDYPVTVTIGSGICQANFTETVTVEEPPSANFTLDYPSPACGPLEVQIADFSTGDNLVYEWNIAGTVVNGPDPGNVVLDNTGTITLVVSNGCGSSSHSELVEVLPTPVAGFGANQYVCSGDTLEIYNVATLYDELFWDFGNGQTSTDTNTQHVVYFTGPDNDTVQIMQIATNECGPDTSVQTVIVVPTDASANVTTSAAPLFQVCQNEEVCFQSFSQPSGIPLQWNFGDGNTTIGFDVCHAFEAPGTYDVVAKLVSCGFDSTVITVTVLPIPAVAFAAPGPTCPGQPLAFQNQSSGAVGYVWHFGDGQSSTLYSPSHSYAAAGSYEACLVATSANGCRDTICHQVNISDLPTAEFTVQNPGCQGDPVSFTSTSSPDVVSCAWLFGDGNVSASCTPTHVYAQPGTYAVQLTVTNGAGCTHTHSETVLVGEVPLPAFEVQMLQDCHPASVQFLNDSQLADGYLWDFGDGNTSTLTSPLHTYQQAGTYTVTLTAVADGVCEATATKTVTVYETPVAAIGLAPPAGCAGDVFTFEANASTGTITAYEWDFGDGLFSFEKNPTHVFSAPGTYSTVLTVRNGSFCTDSDTVMVTVHPAVRATALITDANCFGQASGAIDLSLTGGSAPYAFEWSNGYETEDLQNIPAGLYTVLITDVNGCTWDSAMTVQQPPALQLSVSSEKVVSCAGGADGGICLAASGGVPAYTISWAGGMQGPCLEGVAAGQYAVSLTDAHGCLLRDTFEVRQNPPITVLDSVQHRRCFGDDRAFVSIQAIEGGVGGYSVTLSGPDGYLAHGAHFAHLEPGAYHLTVTDALGCSTAKDYLITEPDSIWLDVLDDSIALELGADTTLFIAHNLSLPQYHWEPAVGLDCSDCPEPTARPFDDVQYRLTMTDVNGCTVSDAVYLDVEKVRTVYIPNTFTPNADGRNDRFRIRAGVKSIERVRVFRIFDRWGELVFEASDFDPLENRLEDSWDGRFRGKELAPDVFFFYAEIEYVDGVVKIEKGDVMLVR